MHHGSESISEWIAFHDTQLDSGSALLAGEIKRGLGVVLATLKGVTLKYKCTKKKKRVKIKEIKELR